MQPTKENTIWTDDDDYPFEWMDIKKLRAEGIVFGCVLQYGEICEFMEDGSMANKMPCPQELLKAFWKEYNS